MSYIFTGVGVSDREIGSTFVCFHANIPIVYDFDESEYRNYLPRARPSTSNYHIFLTSGKRHEARQAEGS